LGLGVDPGHLKLIVPLRKNHEENKAIIRSELNHLGLSVILARRECIQTASRTKKAEAASRNKQGE
ncbi:MAG: indolepyruvate ferredoxin oxidoreductase, partial [Bacteroidales bacterium]|nr:indolepyruvate ferredoxin oxidoreductase [Bacteroidales bacterium]